ncbi:MAG: protein phosphatase 2C domain-containing protein, partial [Anaerolineae bacterium]
MNFHGREAVPIRSRRLPQTIETPVSFDAVPHAYVRYAYARSADSMSSGMEGQDYLCYQHNDQRLVFVVADGVGSSFCGNLAARIVGEGLLEWFWALDVAYINGPAALKEAAVSHLNKMQKMAQVEVEEYEIPDEIGGLVRTALESQRDYGSEAIFAACRIDHPNPMIPDGLLSIFWMGDTRIRAFHEEEGELDLGGARNLADRWSTKQGVRGSMSTYMRPLPGIWRVAAYSDGLSAHEEGVLDYTDMKLDSEIRAGSKLPTSDDVSFIDVVRRTAQYEGYPDLPDPNLERPTLEQIWNPQYRETFELRWNWQGETGGLRGGGKPTFLVQEANSPALTNARTFEVTETTWQPPELRKPGHYYYRVRAMPRRGPVSPWSELRQTKVAYPPPPAPDLSVDADRVLTWTEEGEQLDYVLERASDPDFAEVDRVYEGRATHWPITLGAAPPGVYHFRVQAISDGGPGPYSAPVEVSVTPPAPPRPQLGSLSHDAARGVYRLRWQATAGSTFYEIEEREEQRGETRILTTEDTTLPIDPNEKDMGEYTYRVRACHDWDCSDWSNEQTLRITPPAPAAAPTLSTSGPDEDGRIRLTWSEVPRAVDYMVETSESEDFHDARMYLQAEREIAIARREPGVVHLRVCGTNAGGDGPWSAVERIAIAPGTPPWIEITPGEEAIDVAWGAVGGRVRYTLEAAADDGSASEVYRGDETHAAVRPPQGGRIVFRVRAEVPGVASGWQTSDPITVR